MSTERKIPVLVGGPHAGVVVGYDAHVGPAIHLAGPTSYVRRRFPVGTVTAVAYVVGGLTDVEAAEAVWTWLLDAAGVAPDERMTAEEAIDR